ncbi:MAG: ABC transporter permease [Clostridia bacterium]|nr:ABC transporter permease [Clostridia bacterium]
MIRYVLKRLLLLIPVLMGVAFIIFSIMALTPGDPGRMILGENASTEAVAQLNEQLGVNDPFFVRFFNYIYNAVVKLDFGTSYRTSKPVFDDVFARTPNSLLIAFNGILLATIIGIPIGILSAVKQYSAIDTFARVTAMLTAAIPPFWLGMMLIFIFSLKLGWLPSSGAASPLHFILPMITLGIPYAGSQLRMTRSTMLETIRQDYVRTARAKGVPEGTIIFKHALRNALLPIITITATSFGGLLGGAVITETVFSIPGLGTLIVTAIRQRDTPVVLAATIFLAFMFGLIMLAVDLLYAFVDPRIKAKYTK